MRRIVLGSKSPRRHELLDMAGITHEVRTADCDENIPETDPARLVEALSLRKAEAVSKALEQAAPDSSDETVVIGADTIVYFDGQVLGKPKDEADAVRTLTAMSGKTHTVYTGVTLFKLPGGQTRTFHEETRVMFYPVTEEEIRAYVATGDPLDKAGSYGVQGLGAFLVRRIEGDYFTVVGFPLARFLQELKTF